MGVFWALDLVKNRETRETLVPYKPRAPTRPMVDLSARARAAALMPFTNYNRLHVVPPCTVSGDRGQGRPRDPRRRLRRHRQALPGLTLRPREP